MNTNDLVEKAFKGANILKDLVDKYKKVYVHCTAGISRAPHIVICYLCLFKGFELEVAIKFVRERRTSAIPNKEWLQQVMAYINDGLPKQKSNEY